MEKLPSNLTHESSDTPSKTYRPCYNITYKIKYFEKKLFCKHMHIRPVFFNNSYGYFAWSIQNERVL
jgi:hypothetical protein